MALPGVTVLISAHIPWVPRMDLPADQLMDGSSGEFSAESPGAWEALADGDGSVASFPEDLDLVLAHIRASQRSQSSPATGHYTMSDEHFRACIDALRDQGHKIVQTTVTGGDRASNETGYLLIEGASDPAHLAALRDRAAHLRAGLDQDPSGVQHAGSTPPRGRDRGVDVHAQAVAVVDPHVPAAAPSGDADVGL